MDDSLISRQTAIDALNEYFERIGKLKRRGLTKGEKAISLDTVGTIKTLPSAQPEPPWILCEERMPEEHEWLGTKKFGTTISDEVYVTFENEKGERFCKHLSFHNGELSSYDQFHMDTWYKGSKPIAWMPLPEPYNPNK